MPSLKWIRLRTGLLCQWEIQGPMYICLGKESIVSLRHLTRQGDIFLKRHKNLSTLNKKSVSGIEPKITLRYKTNRFIFTTKQCLISFLWLTSPSSFPRSVFFVWRATSTLFTCFSFIENSRQSFHPLWSFSCFRLHFYSQKIQPIYNGTTRQSPEGLSLDVAEPVLFSKQSYCPYNSHWLDSTLGFSVPVEPLELNGTCQIPTAKVQHPMCLPRCTHITHFLFHFSTINISDVHGINGDWNPEATKSRTLGMLQKLQKKRTEQKGKWERKKYNDAKNLGRDSTQSLLKFIYYCAFRTHGENVCSRWSLTPLPESRSFQVKWILLPFTSIRPCVLLAQRRIHTGIAIIFSLIHNTTWQASMIFGLRKLQLLSSVKFVCHGFPFIWSQQQNEKPRRQAKNHPKNTRSKKNWWLPYLSPMLSINS